MPDETVMLALPLLAVAAAEAVKVVLLAPAATVTDAGTLIAPLSLVIEKDVAAAAVPVKVNVHVADPPALRVGGAQLKPARETAAGADTPILPAIPATPAPNPSGVAASPPATCTPIAGALAPAAIVKLALATTPAGTRLVFNPVSRQV